MQTWEEAQKWEAEWHDTCINSYNEETKQYIYARFMGLDEYKYNYYGQIGWDFGDKKVLDIGCGPYSILLKSKAKRLHGIDPCNYPQWVYERYTCAGIYIHKMPAEYFVQSDTIFDEVLIYNCLQHVKDPNQILQNAINCSRTIRVFEWIDNGISDGHLHDLKAEELDEALGGYGKRDYINVGPCIGKAYWGIFRGKYYQ
jgi:2-polyprenyl-3-methyl-5-hydroxy-6-metoxy-1,4-benzoquinol methylase